MWALVYHSHCCLWLWRIPKASQLERWLPLHDIQHADWHVAQGENKEHHHQHASCLASGSDLFDLSTNCAGSHPHRLSWPRGRSGALNGLPFPLQHWCASRDLLITQARISLCNSSTDISDHMWRIITASWHLLSISVKRRTTHLLAPQLVTYLYIRQDHQA